MAVQWPRLFFYPLTGTEHGSQSPLTTRDRELVSVLEVRIEPGDLNPRPLTRQSVTLPTQLGLGVGTFASNVVTLSRSGEDICVKCRHVESEW